MRGLVLTLAGVGCIALGGLILGGQITIPRSEQVIDIGVLRATAQTSERLPQWVGFAALAAGVLLMLGGRRRE